MTREQRRIWTAIFAETAVLIGQLDPTWNPRGLDKPAALEMTRQNLISIFRAAEKHWPNPRPNVGPT